MTKIFLILCIPYILFAVYNPYKQLKSDEKLNVLINYFVNEELSNVVDKKPKHIQIANTKKINPVKYELYFTYIQRLKRMNDAIEDEQKDIDEEYKGKVGFYNGKLNQLKKYYHLEENLHPILQNAFNKAFKIVYGQPKLKNIKYDDKSKKVTSILWVDDIYGYDKWHQKEIELKLPEYVIKSFIENNKQASIKIRFDYTNNIIALQDVMILYNNQEYRGLFIDKIDFKMEYKIKINDNIFQPIVLNKKKEK